MCMINIQIYTVNIFYFIFLAGKVLKTSIRKVLPFSCIGIETEPQTFSSISCRLPFQTWANNLIYDVLQEMKPNVKLSYNVKWV